MYSFTQPKLVCFEHRVHTLHTLFFRVCRVCSLLCCAKLKQTAESCILFFVLFYKKAKIIFFIECTQIKADLLQFRLSSWPRGVASTVRRRINPVIAPAPHACAYLSTFTIQPVHYHYIKQPVKHMEKHTALFKYVVKSVLFSVITVPPWSYAKHFVLCGYCKGK